jgi:hypothetical protein
MSLSRFFVKAFGYASLIVRYGRWKSGYGYLHPQELPFKINDELVGAYEYTLQGIRVLDKGHVVDFHRDPVSGQVLAGYLPSKLIRYNTIKGFDIKFLWDVSRFQFMSEVVSCAHLKKRKKEIYLLNIEHFKRSNRPYFGPNWICTMDAAIRAVNILYYYEQINQSSEFSQEETNVVKDVLYNHYWFIYNNLEWKEEGRGNHYLSNLCGLVILGTRLQLGIREERIFRFAVMGFIDEVRSQFLGDGCYFENSTGYHRLALEMVSYTVSYMLSMSSRQGTGIDDYVDLASYSDSVSSFREFLQVELVPVLLKAKFFCEAISLMDGKFIQIGDNDSGRFVIRDAEYLDSFREKYGHDGIPQSNYSIKRDIEVQLSLLEVDSNVQTLNAGFGTTFSDTVIEGLREVAEYSICTGSFSHCSVNVFPDFGLVVWNADQCQVFFRCGFSPHKTGHAHEDQLALFISKGNESLLDPGTSTYNRNSAIRYRYQSGQSHFAPFFTDISQGNQLGIFRFTYNGTFRLVNVSESGAIGIWHVDGRELVRKVSISDNCIHVTDYVSIGHSSLYTCTPLHELMVLPLSPEYGVLDNHDGNWCKDF